MLRYSVKQARCVCVVHRELPVAGGKLVLLHLTQAGPTTYGSVVVAAESILVTPL